LGFAPDPTGGAAHSAPSDSLAVYRGPTCKGKGGKVTGTGKERRGEGEKEERAGEEEREGVCPCPRNKKRKVGACGLL